MQSSGLNCVLFTVKYCDYELHAVILQDTIYFPVSKNSFTTMEIATNVVTALNFKTDLVATAEAIKPSIRETQTPAYFDQ
ncbi:hypothetical protein MAM1_0298c09387 [Mucor ambiguus]|uniref:Uncharacterized protein n=1 Tax=Mucor ambiguus TaxID=91626 RepID=A0A0C9MQX9_9FUNG|nr:hypothetical protein MAM1_0298c09387 [Mucor ambiguus]